MTLDAAALDLFQTTPANQVLYGATIALAAGWLGLTALGQWRRRTMNLTPVGAAAAGGARPEFLRVDHARREAALARGDAYTSELDAREAVTASTAEPAGAARAACSAPSCPSSRCSR